MEHRIIIPSLSGVSTPSELGIDYYPALKGHSLADVFKLLDARSKLEVLEQISTQAKCSIKEVMYFLQYEWRGFWARKKQVPPDGDWAWWMVLAGRGFGKTRTGAQWVIERAWQEKGPIALVGQTAADVRDVMIHGPGGIIQNSPPWFKPKFNPSAAKLTWPNGTYANSYSGDYPSQVRGPQFGTAWLDEAAKLRFPGWDGKRGRKGSRGEYGGLLDNLDMALRVGQDPKGLMTTTPRPLPFIIKGINDPEIAVTRGTTMENRGNISARRISSMIKRYRGTELGNQEILGAVIEANPNALWDQEIIDRHRTYNKGFYDLIVVGVDPSGSERGDKCGIIVVARGRIDGEDHFFVLDDMSIQGHPDLWSAQVALAFHRYKANSVIAEINYGGRMVESTLRVKDRHLIVEVIHATQSKRLRAEPFAVLYKAGKVHHVGSLSDLETQMTTWEPGMPSPDLIDALVWGLHFLSQSSGNSSLMDANDSVGRGDYDDGYD